MRRIAREPPLWKFLVLGEARARLAGEVYGCDVVSFSGKDVVFICAHANKQLVLNNEDIDRPGCGRQLPPKQLLAVIGDPAYTDHDGSHTRTNSKTPIVSTTQSLRALGLSEEGLQPNSSEYFLPQVQGATTV